MGRHKHYRSSRHADRWQRGPQSRGDCQPAGNLRVVRNLVVRRSRLVDAMPFDCLGILVGLLGIGEPLLLIGVAGTEQLAEWRFATWLVATLFAVFGLLLLPSGLSALVVDRVGSPVNLVSVTGNLV